MTTASASRILLLAGITSALASAPGAAQLPTWIMEAPARPALAALWRESVSARAERVACLAGKIGSDTVWITGAAPVAATGADSLAVSTEGSKISVAQCGPPRWIGTVHTHVRSTDDPEPVGRFSPGDRAVMSTWAERWSRAGAFCVLHSPKAAHCEVYPPQVPPHELPPSR